MGSMPMACSAWPRSALTIVGDGAGAPEEPGLSHRAFGRSQRARGAGHGGRGGDGLDDGRRPDPAGRRRHRVPKVLSGGAAGASLSAPRAREDHMKLRVIHWATAVALAVLVGTVVLPPAGAR